MAEQSDQRLLVGAHQQELPNTRFELFRLLEDGSPDSSFGNGGILLLHAAPLSTGTVSNWVRAICVLPDDRFLVVYRTGVDAAAPSVVQCYDPDGMLDTAYGLMGTVELGLGDSTFVGSHAVLQPDGKLVVGGRFSTSDGMLRVLPDGTMDLGFGMDGFGVSPSYQNAPFRISHVGLRQDGNIVASDGVKLRLFGPGGLVSGLPVICTPTPAPTYEPSAPRCVNNITALAAGNYSYYPPHNTGSPQVGVFRVTQNGFTPVSGSPPQPSWQTLASGYTPVPQPPPENPIFYRMHGLGADDQFFYAGYRLGFPQTIVYQWIVTKLYASSSNALVSGFGTNGRVQTTFTSETPCPSSLRPMSNGKLIVAGSGTLNGQTRILIARYHNMPDPRSRLHARVFLGGPYDASTGLMRDGLRQSGFFQMAQPYAAPGYPSVNGMGATGYAWAAVPGVEGPDSAVDWVWMELRTSEASGTVVAARPGLLLRDGSVVSGDGHSPIDFGVGAGQYYLRVRHRNHLSVTLAQPITLGPESTFIDLTDPATQTFGTDAQMEVSGVRMLWPGDVNGDGAVIYTGQYNDRDPILQAVGGSMPTQTGTGYLLEDVNLDGVVKYTGADNDRDPILRTVGGTVPTAIRLEQVP